MTSFAVMNLLCGLFNKQLHISIYWSIIQYYFNLSWLRNMHTYVIGYSYISTHHAELTTQLQSDVITFVLFLSCSGQWSDGDTSLVCLDAVGVSGVVCVCVRHQAAFIQKAAMLFCWYTKFMTFVGHIYSHCILMCDFKFQASIKSGRLYSGMPDYHWTF